MLPLSHVGFTTTGVKALETIFQTRSIDYRLLMISALLPDLIDKPIAKLLAGSYEYESRAFGHSLAFLACFMIALLIHWFWRRNLFFLPIVLGIAFHDVLDVMWLHPGILYWPVEGWQFPKPQNEAWQGYIKLFDYRIKQLDFFDNISALFLLIIFMRTALSGKIMKFIRGGKL